MPYARVILVLAFLGFFQLYLRTASPSVYWGEGPLLSISAFQLGISHPPGYSLYNQLCHALTLVPVGSISWRVNVFSALCSAGTVTLLVRGLASYTGGIVPAILAATILATGERFWSMAVIGEVYGLNHLFFAVLVILTERWERSSTLRDGLLVAFVWGLGLLHHMTMVFGALLWLPFLIRKTGRYGVDGWLQGIGLTFVALTGYLYFPIRSVGDCVPDWGDPQRWPEFLTLITAREEVLPSVGLMSLEGIPYWSWIMGLDILREVSLPALFLMGIGLWQGFRTAFFSTLGQCLAAGLLFLAVVYYQSNERAAFLLPVILIAMPTLARGLGLVFRFFRRQSTGFPVLVLAVFLVFLGVRMVGTWNRCDLADNFHVLRFAYEVERHLPPDTFLLTEESDKYFLTAYLAVIEGVGTERLSVFLHLLRFEWFYRHLYESWHWKYWIPDYQAMRKAGVFGSKDDLAESLFRLNLPHHPLGLMEPNFFNRHLYPMQQGWVLIPNGYTYQVQRLDQMAPTLPPAPDLTFYRAFVASGFPRRDRFSADIVSRHLFHMAAAYESIGALPLAEECFALSLGCFPTAPTTRLLIQDRLDAVRQKLSEVAP